MPTKECSPVPIVVIGAGVIGKKHAQTISESSTAELVAIVDPSAGGRVLAEQYAAQYFDSVESFLSSAVQAEGAVVCTPNDTHVPIARTLASAGLHVLVEKPLSSSAADGKSLLVHCAQNRVRVCVGHHRRQNPRIVAAKKALDRESIGRVIGCSGIWATLKSAEYFTGVGSWRREVNGGVVLINAIHEVDMLQYLVGRIVRVYAEKAPSTRGFDAEEGVALTLKFENGAVGTFLVLDNASSPFTFEQATGEFAYHPYTGKDCYRIFGSRGTLNVPTNELWTPENLEMGWKSQLKTEVVSCSDGDAFKGQFQNFIEVIRGTSSPGCSGGDGLAAVAVCEAIRTSLMEQKPVEVQHILD